LAAPPLLPRNELAFRRVMRLLGIGAAVLLFFALQLDALLHLNAGAVSGLVTVRENLALPRGALGSRRGFPGYWNTAVRVDTDHGSEVFTGFTPGVFESLREEAIRRGQPTSGDPLERDERPGFAARIRYAGLGRRVVYGYTIASR